LKAHAKINLSLDVIGKRQDGYHEVRMIMQSIALHDEVVIEKRAAGIKVECDKPWVPEGSGNIAYKAANLMMEGIRLKAALALKS